MMLRGVWGGCGAGALALSALLAAGEARAQSGPFVYVPNAGDNTVSVIDTPTKTVGGSTSGVGNSPFAAAVRGDESLVYVTDQSSNTVSVINTATNAVVATVAVGTGPEGVAVSPDGSRAYVTNNVGGNVSVINTATNAVIATVGVGNNPVGVTVSPDGSRVYVANDSSTTVSVINTATNTVVATVGVGVFPFGVTVSPDGSRIYVTNEASNTISVINTATNAVVATVGVGTNPFGVTISPDGSRVYVANAGNNTVSVIDTATSAVVATVGVGSVPFGVAVSPDGSRIYVINELDNTVSVIDTATDTVVTTLTVGAFPRFPGVCGNGNALLAAGLTFKANTSGALGCTGAGGPVFTGGTMQFAGANIASALPITLMAAGGIFDTAGNNATLSGTISGPGGLTKIGAGILTLSGAGTYSGPTSVNAGTLQAGIAGAFSPFSAYTVASGAVLDLNGFNQIIGSLAGGGSVTLGAGTLTTGNDGTSTTFSGTISGSGGLTKTGAGTLTLSGTESYTGATTVNGGVLDVEGILLGTSAVTVNAGGTLTGTGTIDPVTVAFNSGGTFVPGNGTPGSSTRIIGNLAFQSGALYVVMLNPSIASFASVTGSATLGGATVNAVFAGGSYIQKQYTILTAAGGVSGTFGSLVDTNLPSNFHTTLSYDANNAYLNLILNFAIPGGLNGNQQAVGNALTNFFNSNGSIPLLYSALTAAGLTQASGESATGSQQTTFDAMSQFMGLLTDPFMGRGNGINGSAAPTGYADQSDQASAYAARKKTDAYAMFTKAPPTPFVQRWSVWAAGYGGAQSTSGNAFVGSNDASSRIAGTAVGADYAFSPNTLAGFAIAGGGTNFSMNGLGSGRSDLFQAGAYVRHIQGPAYVSAALAYGWQDITTNRTVTIAGIDQLRAEFNANAYSGRVEGGYRFVAPWMGGIGITPYAAGQFTTFDLPAYAESVVSGSGAFALAYGAKSVTDSRSELGLRTDKAFAMADGIVTLRGRLAWAHDFDPDRSIGATFQALPGASFVVNGAAQAADSALVTAAAEKKWLNGWSAAARAVHEFTESGGIPVQGRI